MTDAHIPDEKFLVLINDLLASGEIPDLFPEDEVENIVSSVRNETPSQLTMLSVHLKAFCCTMT
ncbi:Dynein heavy chain 17, axonemal [Halocaridina rubra]|uniref:Dynein heavy chain 17, axonemal n=1 Tax=Halocaridina rubra TaxID=373956 RepID=A0AAN8ZXJ6_HALRR